MDERHIRHLLVLTLSRLNFLIFALLVHHVMCWMIVFNLVLKQFLNGNQGFGMGIYVGRSPSHASNVSLVLNPRTGHVSPQFHVVCDYDFTTVSYLRTATVPPHWAELVQSLAAIPVYTEKQVGTWQSIPDIETMVISLDKLNQQPLLIKIERE